MGKLVYGLSGRQGFYNRGHSEKYFSFIEHDVTRFIANKCLNPTTLLQTHKMLVLSQGFAEYYCNFVMCIYWYLSIIASCTYFAAVYIYIKRAIATSVDSIIKNLTTTKILIPYVEKLSKGKVSFSGDSMWIIPVSS